MKGKGWNPTTSGNLCGYLMGCIIWNHSRGWVGILDKLYDAFSMVKSMYYGAKTGGRIARRLYRNEVDYAKKRRNKVCHILSEISYKLFHVIFSMLDVNQLKCSNGKIKMTRPTYQKRNGSRKNWKRMKNEILKSVKVLQNKL